MVENGETKLCNKSVDRLWDNRWLDTIYTEAKVTAQVDRDRRAPDKSFVTP